MFLGDDVKNVTIAGCVGGRGFKSGRYCMCIMVLVLYFTVSGVYMYIDEGLGIKSRGVPSVTVHKKKLHIPNMAASI